jgi:hypothetical protein
MIELLPAQQAALNKCRMILYEKGVVYLAGEPRTGKTPTSISLAKISGWKRICIITSKIAIKGIEKFKNMELGLKIDIFIYHVASVGKIEQLYDGFILDEGHRIGAYPRPGAVAKKIKEVIGAKPAIIMSGTPNPESKSQLYHQFWVTKYGPFVKYANFYKFAKDLVDVQKIWRGGFMVNDYKRAKGDLIDAMVKPFMITLSQAEVGIESLVEERILRVPIDKRIYQLIQYIKRDKVYTLKSGLTIVGDTPVKRQSIYHQLCSGTIKVDDRRQTVDESKAKYIADYFSGHKIAVYYKYIQEFEIIKQYFPQWTSDPDEFNKSSSLTFVRQMISGREGVDLSTADALVVYNIDFSATTYFQMRARMQNIDRKDNCPLYWIFSEHGIEDKIYDAVSKKKNFTSDYFKSIERELTQRPLFL